MIPTGVKKIYYIPDNFVGESRILGGRISVRHLVDTIGLSLILFAIIGYPVVFVAMKNAEIPYRASVGVLTIIPAVMLGMAGYNGDPFSVFLVNIIHWFKGRDVCLYNETPRQLGTDPVKAAYESRQHVDKIISMVEEHRQARIDKRNAEEYVEGENFDFEYDPGIDGYTEDVGDYSDDGSISGDNWTQADVEIESGSDLGGLESLFESDWYREIEENQRKEEAVSGSYSKD